MKKNLMLPLLILLGLGFSNQLNSQKLEIDLSAGFHRSKTTFHHTMEVQTKSDKSYDNKGNHYIFGLTANLLKNWKFRTELGFLTTETIYGIIYNYDEGFGVKSAVRVEWLTNQKLYLGLLPEKRFDFKYLSLSVFGGILFSKDITNDVKEKDLSLKTSSKPLALKLGAGVIIPWKNFGIKFNTSYSKFGKSELINAYHPYISYDQINFTMGIFYKIGIKA